MNYTFSEYQRDAARTINQDLAHPELIRHALYGLASETGEVLGIFQKRLQGHPMDIDHVEKELGDVIWFAAELATALGLDLDRTARKKIDKLKQRYPEKFDAWHSMHRRGDDI